MITVVVYSLSFMCYMNRPNFIFSLWCERNMFYAFQSKATTKKSVVSYLCPCEERTFLSDIYWAGTECVGHRTYIFLHLEDKARLLHKVLVLYIPARNVWEFLLHHISFPLNVVRLTKKEKKKKQTSHCQSVDIIVSNCDCSWCISC